MKTYGLVAIIAFGMLSGCSLPRRQLVEKSAPPTEPVASATTEEENLTVAEPLEPVAERVSRLPFTGDVDEENFVQLASHALQPAQDEEYILPEVLELPTPSDRDGSPGPPIASARAPLRSLRIAAAPGETNT